MERLKVMATEIAPGKTIASRYTLVKVLGKGSFGHTYAAIDTLKHMLVAIKIQKLTEESLSEVKNLIFLRDAFQTQPKSLVTFYTHFNYNGNLFIVMECLSSNLRRSLRGKGRLNSDKIKIITKGLLNALNDLYRVRFIHADIKPENIGIVDNGYEVKLIDFGLGVLPCDLPDLCVQTRPYRSPEVFLQLYPYTTAIDMWSLGCVVFELFTGQRLFGGGEDLEQIRSMINLIGEPPAIMMTGLQVNKYFKKLYRSHPLAGLKNISTLSKKHPKPETNILDELLQISGNEDFVDFVKQCLLWDPNLRMKPQEGLDHPWMKADSSQTKPKKEFKQIKALLHYFKFYFSVGYNFLFDLFFFWLRKPRYVIRDTSDHLY